LTRKNIGKTNTIGLIHDVNKTISNKNVTNNVHVKMIL